MLSGCYKRYKGQLTTVRQRLNPALKAFSAALISEDSRRLLADRQGPIPEHKQSKHLTAVVWSNDRGDLTVH